MLPRVSAFTQPIRATGKIDLLLEVNGEIWVMDFKTGRVKDALDQSYPLALYVTAARLERDLEHLVDVGREAFLEQEFLVRPSVLCAWCEFDAVCVGQAA